MTSSTALSALKASLTVSLPVGIPNQPPEIIHEGILLKRKRKKMQGFARRYFTLYSSGQLSYSFEAGQPVRDSITLQNAAISTAPGRKDIHIDSNTATFHIKCLTEQSFNEWMTVFRRFITSGHEARRSASIRIASRIGNLSLKSGAVIEEMGLTIAQLEESMAELHLEYSHKKRHSFRDHSKDKHKEHTKDKSKEHAKHKDHAKEGGGASVFGLFKRASHPSGEGSSAKQQPAPAETSALDRVQSAITTLKLQHANLAKSHHSFNYIDTNQPQQNLRSSPLPLTAEEEEEDDLSTPNVHRTSIHSDFSEWFDAQDTFSDGPQEFVLDVEAPQEDMSRNPSRIISNDSRSTLGPADSDESEDEIEVATQLQLQSNSSVTTPDTSETSTTHELSPREKAQKMNRRVQLPAKPVGDEGSLFAVLKKNVGKDLSTIALPCTFNEPLTLLQRAAEEVEYYQLLDQVVNATDPVERISYVAAFVVAGYAHTRHRSGRKGFMPLLGETFEDPRMNFISEKVVHNPLVMAWHAEGTGWELYATSSGKTKFWGKSLEIIPIGKTTLKIRNPKTGDVEAHYEWNRPSSFMRNLIVGKKYLEHVGASTVQDLSHNGLQCELDFKQGGYFGPANVVSGIVQSHSSKHPLAQLEGKWDESFSQAIDQSTFRVLWKASPYPKNTHEYYGFTSLAMTLNELTSDFTLNAEDKNYYVLPLTDSRRRPDVRALEEGDLELAEEEKMRVEEMQRERRRQGKDVHPRWFKEVNGEWTYTGDYWDTRARPNAWGGSSALW